MHSFYSTNVAMTWSSPPIWASLKKSDRQITDDIYVIEGPLIGRPAVERLGVVLQVDKVHDGTGNAQEYYQQLYPQLFTGLGKIEGLLFVSPPFRHTMV